MKANFLFGEDEIRLIGDVVRKNVKSVWVKVTLSDDFGGKTITLKRNIQKHQVQFLNGN